MGIAIKILSYDLLSEFAFCIFKKSQKSEIWKLNGMETAAGKGSHSNI